MTLISVQTTFTASSVTETSQHETEKNAIQCNVEQGKPVIKMYSFKTENYV